MPLVPLPADFFSVPVVLNVAVPDPIVSEPLFWASNVPPLLIFAPLLPATDVLVSAQLIVPLLTKVRASMNFVAVFGIVPVPEAPRTVVPAPAIVPPLQLSELVAV